MPISYESVTIQAVSLNILTADAVSSQEVEKEEEKEDHSKLIIYGR